MTLRFLPWSLLLAAALFAADPVVEDARAKIKAGKYPEAIAELDAARAKNPKSDEIRKALAEAHMANADFHMNNPSMPPFRKYPTALREYRKVLEYDKDNRKAKENIATIEGIYRSMGREIPK
jgi:tetratricopeptide (TPR) repeat protein